MSLEAPRLDDRTFKRIFEELQARIPQYAPEWTDRNLSDPGITLLQLFSWLGEMILYRLNRVPERNYIEFLRLIGVQRKPAVPAKVLLTFTPSSSAITPLVIASGTRVGATAPAIPASSLQTSSATTEEEEEPPLFETDFGINVIVGSLSTVAVFDGINIRDRTIENSEVGQSFEPFGFGLTENSWFALGLDVANNFPTDELCLTVRVYDDPHEISERSCPSAGLNASAPAQLIWEYWSSGDWLELEVLKDETNALTQSGHIFFMGPNDIARRAYTGVSEDTLFWLRCRLLSQQYESRPLLDSVLINSVTATAIATAVDETAGSSNGQAGQTFSVKKTPVHAENTVTRGDIISLASVSTASQTDIEREADDLKLRDAEYSKGFLLEIDESSEIGPRPWLEVGNFLNSMPEDRHYTLDRSAGLITFGDGNQGRIPTAGSNNIIARHYRYGGGASTNAAADTVTDLHSAVSGIEKVTNLWAAEGGTDEESVDDTKARAPEEFKARYRAVSSEDFELLARKTPGARIRRAHALPLYHPQFPEAEVPGVVTVIVIPESDDPRPVPSDYTMQEVCAYLRERRLLTAEVIVAPPNYRHIKIETTVLAHATYDPARARANVDKALNRYLHPLWGGADEQGWPIGEDVLYSEVFRVVLNVEGVQTIDNLRIIADGFYLEACESASVANDQLVYSDGHDVSVRSTEG
jgi:uncharacterized phage protein gp47/JayE